MGGIDGLEGPIIIALVSIGGIIVTLMLNIRASKRTEKSNFVNFFYQFTKDHSKLIQDEGNLDTWEKCEVHAISYFDLLNHFAFLCDKDYVDKEIGDQFRRYFSYVQAMMNWYDGTFGWNNSIPTEKRWENITKWCKNNSIEPDSNMEHLPDIMQNIYKIFKKDKKLQGLLEEYSSLVIENNRTPENKELFKNLKNEIKIHLELLKENSKMDNLS